MMLRLIPYHPGRLYCNTFNQAAYRSDDGGKTWKKIRGYDFHWGQRIIVDQHDPEQVYITTFGSSVWHGIPGTVDRMADSVGQYNRILVISSLLSSSS